MVRIVVSLGTDHHRFDRLVDWLDEWVRDHPVDVTVTLQHGHSRPSKYADNLQIVARDQLLAAMRAADVVITQAGPGSVVDAHDSGHVPVVVPRSAALAEVVDDHQSIFAELMERLGDCVVARDKDALRDLLDRASTDAAFLLREQRESPAPITAAAVRKHMDGAVRRGPGWVRLGRLRDLVAGPRGTSFAVVRLAQLGAVTEGAPLDPAACMPIVESPRQASPPDWDGGSAATQVESPAGTPYESPAATPYEFPAATPYDVARPSDRIAVLRFRSRRTPGHPGGPRPGLRRNRLPDSPT